MLNRVVGTAREQAQGDIELAETRAGKPLSEADQEKIVRKLIKSNHETIAAVQDEATKTKAKSLARVRRRTTSARPSGA